MAVVGMHCQNTLGMHWQKMLWWEPSQKCCVAKHKRKREGFNTTLFPGGPPPQY